MPARMESPFIGLRFKFAMSSPLFCFCSGGGHFSYLPAQRASLHLDDQYLSAGVGVVPSGFLVASGGGAGGRCDVLDQAVEAEVDGFVSELLSGTMAIEVKLARPVVACLCREFHDKTDKTILVLYLY